MNRIKKKNYPQIIKKLVTELYAKIKLLTDFNFKIIIYSHVNKHWKNIYKNNNIKKNSIN